MLTFVGSSLEERVPATFETLRPIPHGRRGIQMISIHLLQNLGKMRLRPGPEHGSTSTATALGSLRAMDAHRHDHSVAAKQMLAQEMHMKARQEKTSETLAALLAKVRACSACAGALPLGPRPILQLSTSATILVASQAPGSKVHQTGVPFSDVSGDRLREWMGLSADEFYDEKRIAILPMGFCYPGRAGGGDAPPRAGMRPSMARPAPAIASARAPHPARRKLCSAACPWAGSDCAAGEKLPRLSPRLFPASASVMEIENVGGEEPVVR